MKMKLISAYGFYVYATLCAAYFDATIFGDLVVFFLSVQNFITASFFFRLWNTTRRNGYARRSSVAIATAEKSLIKWCNADYNGYLIIRTSRVKITFAPVCVWGEWNSTNTIPTLYSVWGSWDPMTSFGNPYAFHFLSSICNMPLILKSRTTFSTPQFCSTVFFFGRETIRTV